MTHDDNTISNEDKRERYDRPKEADVVDQSLTLEECIEARSIVSPRVSEIGRSVDSIKVQIGRAKTEKFTTGIYSEAQWWRRASDALRHQSRSYQEHCRALSNLSRRIKELTHEKTVSAPACRERAFIDHARALLPKETYMEIWSRVTIDHPELSA